VSASAEIVDTPEEAAEQELAPLIVRGPLERFMDSHGLGSGRVEADRIGEGHSNVTYLLTRGGERYVLRRPPRPPSAHDVLREARLVGAIEGADVRTPRILATCDDDSLIGVPFYVMAFEDGHVITSSVLVTG
jgi:aminoglycoside phosphotransferase (APT) family kinase protein